MLASFPEGRRIIVLIVKKPVPISIFSYLRPLSKITKETPKDIVEAMECWEKINTTIKKPFSKLAKLFSNYVDNSEEVSNGTEEEEIVIRSTCNPVQYRSSEPLKIESGICDIKTMATNENVLTVLIETLSYDLFRLLFNRILLDSKKLGPGCLSSLTDALVFLQEAGSGELKLSYKRTYSVS